MKTEYHYPCQGIHIEGGVYSGCNGGNDCPVCEGTSEIIYCPECLEVPAFSVGNVACPHCGWEL